MEIEVQLRARGLRATADELAELEEVYPGLQDWIARVERLAQTAPE